MEKKIDFLMLTVIYLAVTFAITLLNDAEVSIKRLMFQFCLSVVGAGAGVIIDILFSPKKKEGS